MYRIEVQTTAGWIYIYPYTTFTDYDQAETFRRLYYDKLGKPTRVTEVDHAGV